MRKRKAAPHLALNAEPASPSIISHSTSELLQLLEQHPGREYQAYLLRPAPLEPACYSFACCSQGMQATGPSGQMRFLSTEQFYALFGAAQFARVSPTGRLTDLGPLFEALTLPSPSPSFHTD